MIGFNYFIGSGLNASVVGPTDATDNYSGNGGVNYGVLSIPVPISGSALVARVACGSSFSADDKTAKAYIDSSGDLYVWGKNLQGELGLDHLSSVQSPTKAATGVSKVFVSSTNVYTIKTDGTLWGAGKKGLLGSTPNGDKVQVFTQIGSDSTWVWVAPHHYGTVAQNAAGELYYINSDGTGVLYVTNSVSRITSSGNYLSHPVFLFVTTGGALFGYAPEGSNDGIIPGKDSSVVDPPEQIGTATDWASVHSAPYSKAVFALNSAKELYYWGTPNNAGQWGLGNTNSMSVVTSVTKHSGTKVFVDIFAAAGYTTGIEGFNKVYSWGDNDTGSLGIGADVGEVVPVMTPAHASAGPYYGIAGMYEESGANQTPIVVSESLLRLKAIAVTCTAKILYNSGELDLPTFKCSGSIETNSGVRCALPAFSAHGVATTTRLLDTGVMELNLRVSASGIVGKYVFGNAAISRIGAKGSAVVGVSGGGLSLLKGLSARGVVSIQSVTHGAVALAKLVSYGLVDSASILPYSVLAFNKTTEAFSTHEGYEFNAAGVLGSEHVLSSSAGMLVLVAASDDAVCEVELPLFDLEEANYKHIRRMYVDVVASDVVEVTVTSDSGDSYTRKLGKKTSSAMLRMLEFNGRRSVAGRSFSVNIKSTSGLFRLNGLDAYIIHRGNLHG